MLWDLASWQISEILTGPNNWVDDVVFSPNSDILVGASRDGLVYLWRLSDGILFHSLGAHSSGVETVCFSFDGSVIATGSYGSVKIWGVDAD